MSIHRTSKITIHQSHFRKAFLRYIEGPCRLLSVRLFVIHCRVVKGHILKGSLQKKQTQGADYNWLQGTVVDGPVPAPFLAPAMPKTAAPVAAPMPSAQPDTPLSFLIKGITDLANSGRKLSQQQPATTGYHNPKPLITVEPHLLVDQKNEKSLLQGGDVVFANGARIPLPGGIPLPTTGLWHQLLDIPQVWVVLDL